MDNQQATNVDYYIAGLFDGEGSLMITKHHRKDFNRNTYRAMIQFTNTDPLLVNLYVDWCKSNGFAQFVHTDDRSDKKNRVCYQVSVSGLGSMLRWLDKMIPLLVGKKAQAVILRNFIARRISRNADHESRRGSNGQFVTGGRAPFDDVDLYAFDAIKEARKLGASETTRVPWSQGQEDIVQSLA